MNDTTEKTYELRSIEITNEQVIDEGTLEELAIEVMELMDEADDATKCRRLEAVTNSVNCKADIYEDYSGRCMYGKSCVGITTDDPTQVIEMAAQYGITGAKLDGMGLDSIVYWPKIKWVEEGEEDDV